MDLMIDRDLDPALTAARERYAAARPQSLAAHREAAAVMPGGNTRSTLFYSPFPLTVASGSGCRFTDLDGHEYVDLLGDYTAGLFGHSNPLVRAAIQDVLQGGWALGAQGTAEARLAEVLCARFPSLELVRFTNSGTEANLLAVATAVAVTGRDRVLVFDGAYHGGVLSFAGGGSPVNVPHRWLVGRYNDADHTAALIAEHGRELAAILVEPMMGSGGCLPADPEFLTLLRAKADETGAVLVFDEVMTSRMSAGGQQARLAITPDLTTLGKYLGGGLSFGAFGGRRTLMERFDPRRPDALPHAGTFNNNVFSMAAGHAGLTQVFTPAAADALFARGEALRDALNGLAEQRSARMQWTGLGSLMTVHFQREPIRAPADLRVDPALRELFHLDMLDRGFHLARRGMIALSLEVGTDELDAFLDAVSEFLDSRASVL